MIPFLPSAGGNCQDASILVEVFAVRDKLTGAFEGTVIEKGITLDTKRIIKKSTTDSCLIGLDLL